MRRSAKITLFMVMLLIFSAGSAAAEEIKYSHNLVPQFSKWIFLHSSLQVHSDYHATLTSTALNQTSFVDLIGKSSTVYLFSQRHSYPVTFIFYDVNRTYISQTYLNTHNSKITTPENTQYIRLNISNTSHPVSYIYQDLQLIEGEIPKPFQPMILGTIPPEVPATDFTPVLVVLNLMFGLALGYIGVRGFSIPWNNT